MKIHPLGTEMCHVDGQTDMTKLTVAFRNFAKAPKDGEQKRILMGITMSPLVELISKGIRYLRVHCTSRVNTSFCQMFRLWIKPRL